MSVYAHPFLKKYKRVLRLIPCKIRECYELFPSLLPPSREERYGGRKAGLVHPAKESSVSLGTVWFTGEDPLFEDGEIVSLDFRAGFAAGIRPVCPNIGWLGELPADGAEASPVASVPREERESSGASRLHVFLPRECPPWIGYNTENR